MCNLNIPLPLLPLRVPIMQSRSSAKRLAAAKSVKGVPASVAIELQPPSKFGSAAEYFPPRRSIGGYRASSKSCRACDLWRTGTQTVFGEGKATAEVVFVGEQPGNDEDLAGKPFVGPAGKIFNQALEKAGIDRSQVYVTNAVKHFKWEPAPRGERRIHKKPNDAEVKACRPWLDAELSMLRPRVLVLLGATAAQALLGKKFRVTQSRGKPQPSDLAPVVIATVHPSSLLRAPTPEARRAARAEFVADLRVVATHINARAPVSMETTTSEGRGEIRKSPRLRPPDGRRRGEGRRPRSARASPRSLRA